MYKRCILRRVRLAYPPGNRSGRTVPLRASDASINRSLRARRSPIATSAQLHSTPGPSPGGDVVSLQHSLPGSLSGSTPDRHPPDDVWMCGGSVIGRRSSAVPRSGRHQRPSPQASSVHHTARNSPVAHCPLGFSGKSIPSPGGGRQLGKSQVSTLRDMPNTCSKFGRMPTE